jgi:hypothetical protein
MLHEIGIIALSEQRDLVTTPSNKFHQMTLNVKYSKRGGLLQGMNMLLGIKII